MSIPPLVHRAVLPVRSDDDVDLMAVVRRCTTSWVQGKHPGGKPLSASGIHQVSKNSTLYIASAYAEDGSESGLRYRLRDTSPAGLFHTTVTAVSTGPKTGWVSVDLEYNPTDGEAVNPGRPRLIGELTEELPLRDGPAPLTVRPQPITALRIHQLVAVLTNSNRRLPCIVIARPTRHTEGWRQKVTRTIRGAVGSASLYELEDEAACNALRNELGDVFRVAPGAIRTYLPDVDIELPADSHRHRLLSQVRLMTPDGYAWKNISRNVQERARSAPLPSALRGAAFQDAFDIERATRNQERASAREASTNADASGELRDEIEYLTSLLSLADQQYRELKESYDLASRQVESLAERHENLELEIDEEITEHLSTQEQLSKIKSQLARVQNALLNGAGGPEDAFPVLDPEELPDSFEELLDNLPRLPHILYTGDKPLTLELDEVAGSKRAVWARKAWEALRSLDSYARAKKNGFSGAFYEFCQNPPPGGRNYAHKQVAMSESRSTLTQWGDERVFPVPLEVHPDGEALMEAHIKLDSRGSISPRLHFLDCTADHGQVVVGFIGRHLRNTRTN